MNPISQSWLSANIKSLTTILVVVASFSYFFFCLIGSVKPDPQILICVTNADMLVLGYWFGSSSSSSKKDDSILSSIGNPTVTGDSPIVNVNQAPEAEVK